VWGGHFENGFVDYSEEKEILKNCLVTSWENCHTILKFLSTISFFKNKHTFLISYFSEIELSI